MNCSTVAYTVLGLFVLTLAYAGLAAADDPILDPNEPPVRLKKKKNLDGDKTVDKKTEPRKDGEDKKDDENKKKDGADKDKILDPEKEVDPKEERERLIKGMLKKMETVEERLAKNDPGLGTREMQRDILKDLDALIEQTKKQPPPQSRRQSSRSQKNSRNPKNSKNSGNPKNSKDSKKSKDKKGQRKDKASANSKKGREGKKDGNGQGGKAKNAKKNKSKLAELYKDVWGELPKTLRLEMDAYSRAKYIREYEALLKQYYRTISEEDRSKKGE
jgi:hypothetical protein